jgi:uncharacterized membrane protein YgdD (TMEM256/DUF423 family)
MICTVVSSSSQEKILNGLFNSLTVFTTALTGASKDEIKLTDWTIPILTGTCLFSFSMAKRDLAKRDLAKTLTAIGHKTSPVFHVCL